jgi:hypothetical protein
LTKKRLQPGLPVSAAAHAGLLLATLLAFADARRFEDAQEAVPVDIVTDSAVNEVMKGEKTAKEIKPVQRADKQAPTSETKPLPPLAEAKKDIAAPPPQLRRRQDEPEDKPEAPPPPKRVAALPPTPEPPTRPTPSFKPEPQKPAEQHAKPEPTKPEPPKPELQKPQAKAAPTPPEREPEEAEVVRPKPPQRSPEKVEKAEPEPPAKPVKQETAKPEPSKQAERPKAKDEPRLKVDEVAKLLERSKSERSKSAEKAAAGDGPQDSKSDKPAAKPKSGDETAPKSKFDAANIANLLSREAPQRRAATGQELTKTASLGAPTASASRMSPTMEARINDYLIENYRRCWQSALVKNARAYVPLVEFRLTRNGSLEGAPRLLNPSSDPVERSRGEQALAAIRRCSPMTVPEFFAPYYDHWHVTTFNMTDDM